MDTLAPAPDSTRMADAAALARALQDSRADTLATFGLFESGLPGLAVPQRGTLNPPLWELGHIGWFQEHWLARNPQRAAGTAADPGAPRAPGVRASADALYDSSRVAHAARWSLPLPDAAATRLDLARQLHTTLALLPEAGDDDEALYFFRLVLFHEDMHHEAALYMAQSLGVAVPDARWQAPRLHEARRALHFDPGIWRQGLAGAGFAFDNERCAHELSLPGTAIDSRVLTWAEFLPFVDDAGYAEPRWWDDAGAAWLAASQRQAPRYLRREGAAWQQWRHGRWQPLHELEPACHLTLHEAQAWCRWAGRRLPTEAEWERAALQAPQQFAWGAVWEWTASPLAPYPGFRAHPYRDYSAPWFGTRHVLRGASFMTQPRMRHPRYRNFFAPDRDDVPVGLRTCALRVPG